MSEYVRRYEIDGIAVLMTPVSSKGETACVEDHDRETWPCPSCGAAL